MDIDLTVLAATAASVALVHTLLGPDHYLPFIVLGKTRQWSRRKVIAITTLCGIGHVGGSIALGAIGIALGVAVGTMEFIEGTRGEWAAWALLAFGLAYGVWGLRRAQTNRTHTHPHAHADGTVHHHHHHHRGGHVHVHDKPAASMTPWMLFIVFVLGPCEPLIPLLMVPAAEHSWMGVAIIAGLFGIVTIATMLTVVLLGVAGLGVLWIKPLERYAHALAGGAIAMCGFGMAVLGL
ncbi:MAG: hypothetical protein KDE14_02655 [Rhodobacteraceae bacterium]|nr:hypothetical protein [Paracoccaceae bacterium]